MSDEERIEQEEVENEQVETETDETGETGDEQAHTDEPDPQAQRSAHLERIERQLEKAANAFDNASRRLANNPTAKNAEDAEKAAQKFSKLKELIASDDLDIDPGKGIRTLAGEVDDYQKKQGETQAQLLQRMQQLAQEKQQLHARLGEIEVRSSFERDHPELKGRYEELVKEARKQLAPYAEIAAESSDPAVEKLFQTRASEVWQSVVNSATKSDKTPKVKDSAKTPGVGKSIKSKSGQASAEVRRTPAEILYGKRD